MLCCFGRPSSPAHAKETSAPTATPTAAPALSQDVQPITVVEKPPCLTPGLKVGRPVSAPVGSLNATTATRDQELTEPWHDQLAQRISSYVAANGLRAAGCWVRSKDKCFLVAAAPTYASRFRASLHGYFVGSSIDLQADRESSVALALSTKTAVSAVFPVGGPVPSDVPADLRQLSERLGRAVSCVRPAPSGATPAQAWHLAALPLLSSGVAVGVLVVAAHMGDAEATARSPSALGPGATASHAKFATSLVEDFFGTLDGRTSAKNVCMMIAAVAAAPDHASAVRDASAQVHAHLVATEPQLPRLCVTPALVVSKNALRGAIANGSSSAAAATAANGGPQLYLFCNPSGKPIVVPVSETLMSRAPVRADTLAAILTEALAAPVSSAALAAARTTGAPSGACRPATGSGQQQQQQQKRVVVQCPEDELPSSQCSELAVLTKAKARATRGSVVMVSCPLSSILCAVVMYVSVVPPETCSNDPSAAVTDGVAGETGSNDQAKPSESQHAVQLTRPQLDCIVKLVASDVEVVASALEQRMISSCRPLALTPVRQGSKGPYVLDVSADTSGQLTVSVATTDAADDSNGFWGSASGNILSSELSGSTLQSGAGGSIPASGGGAPVRSQERASHVFSITAVSQARPALPLASPLGLSSSPARSADGDEAAPKADVSTLEAMRLRLPGSSCEAALDSHAAPATTATTGETASSYEPQGPCDVARGPLAAGAQVDSKAHREPWLQRGSGVLIVRGHTGGDITTQEDMLSDKTGARRCVAAISSDTTGVSSAALATVSYCIPSDNANATTTTGMWPANGSANGSRDGNGPGPQALSLSLRPDTGASPSGCVLAPGPSSGALPPTGKGSGSLPLVAAAAVRSRPVTSATPSAPTAVVLPRTPPPGLMRCVSAGPGGVGGIAQQSGASSTCAGHEYGYGKPPVESVMATQVPSDAGGVRSLGSSGCALPGAASGSIGRVTGGMFRHRSKDWSDQAGEVGDTSSRTLPTAADGSTAPARMLPVKVLSADKAALQLARTSGSTHGGSLIAPAVPHAPYTSIAAGHLTASAGSTGTAPRPYVPHMPRRLNRMYLPPPAASGAFPAGVGVPLSPASVATSTAMLAGPLVASATPTPSSGSVAGSISQTAPGPGSHSGDGVAVRLLNAFPASEAGIPPQGTTRLVPTAACALGPFPASALLGLQGVLPLSLDPQTAATCNVHGLQLQPTRAAAGSASMPSLAMPPPAPPRLPPSSPSSLIPAPDGAALTAAAASAPGSKNRQLSDYAIPEDVPLESTVSETVQMMRMLSQARGMHLSARMRRVRVTAKIQSAHPDALPANLPSQLARVAFANVDGLFAPGAVNPTCAGNAAAGSWVLTGVAARRGCVELVFDMVLVRGREAALTAAPLGSENKLHGVQSAAAARARRGLAPSAAHQVSSSHPHPQPGIHHQLSSGGGYVSFSQAQGAQPHAQGYRRWQGAESLAGPSTCDMADGAMWAPYPEVEAAGGFLHSGSGGSSGGGGVDGDWSASEQQWIRSSCGLRPEALGDVFQQCGLLSLATDPCVEVQVGHSPTGVDTLLWDGATEQWVAKSSVPPSPSDTASAGSASKQSSCHPSVLAGAVAAMDAAGAPAMGAAGAPAALEAPTLWLPCAVALLPQGAHVLEHVRVVSKGVPGSGEVDDLMVRSACGYLPLRVSGGVRTRHGQGAAQGGADGDGAGSSSSSGAGGGGVWPLPLLLDEDAVAEQFAEGDCCWRLLDVLGPLPREGGLLLVESRRSRTPAAAADGNVQVQTGCRGGPSTTVAGPCDADATSAARYSAVQAPMAVTSAPVPLVLLSERDAAAAAELQSLRSYMTRLLLGSDTPLRSMGAAAVTPEAVVAAGAAAAQVEMACQQFLMDLGLLLDAAAAAGSGALSLPGPSSSTVLGVAQSIAAAPSSMDTCAAAAGQALRNAPQPASPGPNSLGESGRCGGHVSRVITVANQSQSKPPTKGSEQLASPACTTDALSSMPLCSSLLNNVGMMSEGDTLSVAGSSTAAACEHAGGLWSFAEDMKTLLSPVPLSPPTPMSQLGSQQHFLQHQQQQQQQQVRDSVSGGALIAGPCSTCSGAGSGYSDHLLDLACTLLAGCCAAGMRETALLVLCLAASRLALASPQVLLVEASVAPRVMMDLLTAFSFRLRASRDSTHNCGGGSVTGAASAAAAVAVVTATAAAGGSAGGRVAVALLPGPRTPEEAAEGGADGAGVWSTAADSNAAVTSSMSHSHSLAMMLGGCRLSASPTLALSDDAAALGTQDGDSWVGHGVVDGEAEAQEDVAMGPPPEQQRQEGDGHEREATAQNAVWEAMKAGAAQSPLTPPVANMHAMAVGIDGVHSSTTFDLPTWESMSFSTPDSGLAPFSRGASPTRGSARVCAEEDVAEAPAAPQAAKGGAGAAGANGAVEPSTFRAVTAPSPVCTAAVPAARKWPHSPAALVEMAVVTAAPEPHASASTAPTIPTGLMPEARNSLAGDGASTVSGSPSSRTSGAGCSKDPAPGLGDLEVETAEASEPSGAQAAGAMQPGAGVGASGSRFGALCFRDPQLEADYMRFVANRTCGIIWSYFLYVTLTSAVSCTRAWIEDGLPGCVTLLLFSGAQGVLMGWYCIVYNAREPWAMVAAALGCKAVRLLADLLMGLHVLKVPSLLGSFAVRGVEVFAEALMRPIAERVSVMLFCIMLLLEFPCVWLLYRHFQDIFPRYWLRDYPLLRTLVFSLTSLAMNMMAELYWRTEYRRWCRSVSMGAGAAVDGHGGGSSVVKASSAIKRHLKAN